MQTPVLESFAKQQSMVNLTEETVSTYPVSIHPEIAYRILVQLAGMPVIALDQRGVVLLWNNGAAAMLGYEPIDIIGNPFVSLLELSDEREISENSFDKLLTRASAEEGIHVVNLPARRSDGRVIPLEITAWSWNEGSETFFGIAMTDVRPRLEAQRALQHLASYAELCPTPVVELDLNGAITYQNPSTRRFLPDLEALGLGHPFLRDFRTLANTMCAGGEELITREIAVPASVYDQVITYVPAFDRIRIYARDITEKKSLEHKLAQSQKLEAIGSLAAGIAHEINTPIQYVGDSVQFLRNSFEDLLSIVSEFRTILHTLTGAVGYEEALHRLQEEEERADLSFLEEHTPKAFDRISDGITRVTTIVRAMKEFAHPDPREMSPSDLNKALLNTLTVARNEYKFVAEIQTEWGELPPVICHVGDLNQVFLNLIVNAAHAIADVVGKSSQKGFIQIRTTRDGDHVVISITDTGGGIPEEIRTRIFDPFFTTKEVGRGTGQGLAIAHSIVVDRHCGSLTFESAIGHGTTFFIRLPIEGRSRAD